MSVNENKKVDDVDDQQENKDEKEEDELVEVIMTDKHILVDVVDMEKQYGPGHRGMVAKQAFQASDQIQSEIAALYVSAPFDRKEVDGDVISFFLGGEKFKECPVELMEKKSGLIIALTARMICERPDLCKLMMNETSPWGLHGRLHGGTRYELAVDAYALAKKYYLDPAGINTSEIMESNADVSSDLNQSGYVNVSESVDLNLEPSLNQSGYINVSESGEPEQSLNQSGYINVSESGEPEQSLNQSGYINVSESGEPEQSLNQSGYVNVLESVQLNPDQSCDNQPDLGKVWDLKEFGRLYAIIQVNALVGMMPMKNGVYGAGIFPGSVFFNHSCNPNAILVMRPGKIVIQALTNIECGDEVTVAYSEIPIDLLKTNLVRAMHYDACGLTEEHGCKCAACTMLTLAEDEIIRKNGGDPEKDDRFIELDLQQMWVPETMDRLNMDHKFNAYVLTMFRNSASNVGAVASFSLREQYGHFLDPTLAGPKQEGYCADLAFVLGDIYCTHILSIPGQGAENYLWWTQAYLRAIETSQINLPNTLTDALLSRCFAAMMTCQSRDAKDVPNQMKDTNLFLANWVALRVQHAQMFGHTAYLVMACKVSPLLGAMVVRMKDEVRRLELAIQLKAAEEEQKTFKQHQDDATETGGEC